MEELFKKKKEGNISLKLEDLDFSTVAYYFIKNQLGISSLDQFSDITENKVKMTNGFNSKILEEIKEHLVKYKLDFKKQEIFRGTSFWTDEIEKAGIKNQLSFFNDVITEKRPPHAEAGYHLVLKDIILDGKSCDIYHTDQDENGDKIKGHTWHRIFIHIKE